MPPTLRLGYAESEPAGCLSTRDVWVLQQASKAGRSLFNRIYNVITPIGFDPGKSSRNVLERGSGFERVADMDFAAAIAVEDTRQDYGERRVRVFGHIDGQLHVAVITPAGTRFA